MPKCLKDTDSDYFRTIVSIITEHPDWVVDDDFGVSVEQAVDHAADGSQGVAGELQFVHDETDGRLYVRMPDLGSPPNALEALLEQPIDPELDQVDSDLMGRIGEAHQLIVEEHATQYVTGQADSYTVLAVSVPVDYCSQELREAVDGVSTVSKQVAELHEAIKESIDTTHQRD